MIIVGSSVIQALKKPEASVGDHEKGYCGELISLSGKEIAISSRVECLEQFFQKQNWIVSIS